LSLGRNIRRLVTLARAFWSYRRREAVPSYLPVRLWVEPTNACNLKCPMCPRTYRPDVKKGYMDMALFKEIVDEARPFVYNVYLFLGGEPLLHPHLPAMIRYARSAGMITHLHTNATLLTEARALALLKAGLDYLTFSFDGYDKDTYERIRVGADFDRTLSNIVGFLRKKAELGSLKPHTTLQVIKFNDSLDKAALARKRDFQRRFEGLPLDKWDVIKPHNFGGKIQGFEGSYRTKSARYSPCPFLWYSLSVLWDGTIVPCCADLFADYPLGHVKTTGLVGAWRGKRMVALREKLAQGRYQEIELCAECDVLWKKRFFGIPSRRWKDLLNFIAGR